MRRYLLWAAAAGALVVVGAFGIRAFGAADASDDRAAAPGVGPTYYVEGARPAPGATEQAVWVEDGDAPPGCVPYSPERPRSYVCDELPAGFEPAPPPGTSEDYPEGCAIAAKVIRDRAAELSRQIGLSEVFQIDPSGCMAAGMGAAQEGRWMARFPLVREVSAPDGTTYRTAVVWEFTIAGTTVEGEEPPVFLSPEAT